MLPETTPTPDEIAAARKSRGLTQADAAALIAGKKRTWEGWEAGRYPMPPTAWRLFKMLISDLPQREPPKRGRPPKAA